MNGRTRNLIVAVVSGVVGRAVALVTPLLVMAPMLDHLGPALFGIWLTAVSVSAMAAFLDFGVGNASLTRLSEAFGQDDLTAARHLLGQAYALLTAISAVFVALVLAGLAAALALGPTDPAHASRALVIAIVLTAMFLSFPAGLIVRLLQARQRYVHAQLVQLAGPLAALIATLAGIAADLRPAAVVALYALAAATVQMVWSAVYFLRNPEVRPIFAAFDRAVLRRLSGLGGAFFLVSIVTAIGMNLDNLVIAARAGAEAVAEFGVPARLGGLLLQIVFTLFMPLWSLFGDAMARGDRLWLRRTVLRMSALGASGVLVIGLALVVFADPIMRLWMGRTFADQQAVLLGMVASATVIAVTSPFNMVLNAAGLASPQILPWTAFVAVTLVAKLLFLSPGMVWLAPWITAVAYAVLIAPRMVVLALRRIGTAVG